LPLGSPDDAAGLELVHDAQPELGALALLDPQAQDVLVPLAIESQGHKSLSPEDKANYDAAIAEYFAKNNTK
jgi:hypothetical protein